MKPLTAEWLDKAEGDFAVKERGSRVRRNPAHHIVCFHAQQCVEKYLKARLCHTGAEAGRLHGLVALLERVLACEPLWEAFGSILRISLTSRWRIAIPVSRPRESRRSMR